MSEKEQKQTQAKDAALEKIATEEIDEVAIVEDVDNSDTEEALRQAEVKERITQLAKATKDNALSCAVLDFNIIKPYIQTMNVVLYCVAAGFLGFITGNVFLGFIAGFLLGTLYLGYTFAVSQKYETDALYQTLKLSPQSIVAGRYLFTLVFSVLVALGAILLASIGVHFSNSAEIFAVSAQTINTLVSLLMFYLTLVLIQLPTYFHLGFVKARLVGALPMFSTILIAVGLILSGADAGFESGLQLVINAMGQYPLIMLSYLTTLIVTLIISYLFSLSTYKSMIRQQGQSSSGDKETTENS